MPPEYHAIFEDWSPPIFLTTATILTAIVYIRGWFAIRRTRPAQFPDWRLVSFLGGLAVLWLSIGSPMDGFADSALSAHMVEHLLLMSFVPPLVLLGFPTVPLLRGLPRPLTRYVVAPFIRLRPLRRLGHFVTTPVVAWLAMNITFLSWHIPAAYDFALRHERWHDFEHICFLGTSILFWWPIILPWPSHTRTRGWYLILYLVLADIVNTALSAFIAFCGKPLYTYYLTQPNPFGASPMDDQVAGAVIMWVVGSLVFLVPVVGITFHLLQPQKRERH